MISILIVDDDEAIIFLLKDVLDKIYFVHTFLNGKSAIHNIKKGIKYDIAFIDLSLPDISGDEVTEFSKKINPHVPVITMSSYDYKSPLADGRIDKHSRISREKNIKTAINDYLILK